MNKFTKLIKESDSFEEIEDTLLGIYDILGKPNVSTFNVGKNPAYILRWRLDFSISEYNGVEVLDKMSLLFNCISNIKSSQKRISGYDIEFKIGAYFFIRLIPHSESISTEYNFIEEIRDNMYAFTSHIEIMRFFKDHGYSINVKYVNDIYHNYILISTKADQNTVSDFISMFQSELNENITRFSRIYSNQNGVITIQSNDVDKIQFFFKIVE